MMQSLMQGRIGRKKIEARRAKAGKLGGTDAWKLVQLDQDKIKEAAAQEVAAVREGLRREMAQEQREADGEIAALRAEAAALREQVLATGASPCRDPSPERRRPGGQGGPPSLRAALQDRRQEAPVEARRGVGVAPGGPPPIPILLGQVPPMGGQSALSGKKAPVARRQETPDLTSTEELVDWDSALANELASRANSTEPPL
jgi:hypothetical protein